jgi:hypothetical protein
MATAKTPRSIGFIRSQRRSQTLDNLQPFDSLPRLLSAELNLREAL